MNTSLDIQLEASPLSSRVPNNCKPLEDLWKGGRYAYGEILRLSKEFSEAVMYSRKQFRRNHEAPGVALLPTPVQLDQA